MDGYKSMFNDTLVTVWSAPNYCYRCGNVAAILELDENLETNFQKFAAAPQEVRAEPGNQNKKQVIDVVKSLSVGNLFTISAILPSMKSLKVYFFPEI